MKGKHLWLVVAVLAVLLALGTGVSQGQAVSKVTNTELQLSKSQTCAGETVTVTATTVRTEDSLPVDCGTITIQRKVGDGAWAVFDSGSPDTGGSRTKDFDTTGYQNQTVSFQALYDNFPATGGCPSKFNDSSSPSVPLVIGGPCVPEPPVGDCNGKSLIIGATLASGEGQPAPGYSGEWTFVITVKACEDVCGVYAQGGTSGWTTWVSSSPSTGSTEFFNSDKKKSKSSTKVIRWYIGYMVADQEETLEVKVSGTVNEGEPCSTEEILNQLNISGNWSATFSKDECVTFEKSEYTEKVLLTVTCPEEVPAE